MLDFTAEGVEDAEAKGVFVFSAAFAVEVLD
jgi:hypothetical protein